MALQKKHTRKSMSFLTPQLRKTQSPGTRLSLSSNERNPDHLLGSLLNDPIKRALLMEVLSQGTSKEKERNDKQTWKKPQKFKFESPSTLCRRRAIENMRFNSDSSDSQSNQHDQSTKKLPFEKILKGVVVYVEIMSNHKDRSKGAKALMQAMGAEIREKLTREVTHVVFKDGSFKTYQKAKLLKVHLVSVLWIEAVRKYMYRVPEQNYPPLGNTISSSSASFICDQFQKDYADVIEEELNKSKAFNILSEIDPSARCSEDVVDTSQNGDIQSIVSVKENVKGKEAPVTPNSLYLDSTPELTSDSEPEYFPRSRVSRKLWAGKQKSKHIDSKESENGKMDHEKVANIDVDKEGRQNKSIRVSDPKTPGTQTKELSSLRISTDSVKSTSKKETPPQNVLNYNNVTERKKRHLKPEGSDINILSNVVLNPPLENDVVKNSDDILIERIDQNLKELNIEVTKVNLVPDQKSCKKSVRKLYNIDDSVVLTNESNNLQERITKNKINSIQTERKIQNTNDTKTNEYERLNFETISKKLNTKDALTTPSRKSTRLLRRENNESPLKKTKTINNEETMDTREVNDSSEEFETIRSKQDDSKIKNTPKEKKKTLKTTPKSKILPKKTSKNTSPRKTAIVPEPSRDSSDEFTETISASSNQSIDAISNSDISKIYPIKRPEPVVPQPTRPYSDLCKNPTKDVAEVPSKKPKEIVTVPSRRSRRLSTMNNIQDLNPVPRRSTLDFLPKTPISESKSKHNAINKTRLTQKNKLLKKTSIVCTRFHRTEVQVFQQIVKKLGVFVAEDEVTDKTTHLVAAEARRTINLLRAIARGCWVVRSQWLYLSLEAGHWLPEEDYELTEFSVSVQKARQERQAFGARFSMDIFKNCGKICISKATNPRCSDLQELVTLCNGSITTIVRNADIVVGEYVEDKSCVTVQWIMDSITFYKTKSLRNYIIEIPEND